MSSGTRSKATKAGWKPTTPNPAIFKVPKPSIVHIRNPRPDEIPSSLRSDEKMVLPQQGEWPTLATASKSKTRPFPKETPAPISPAKKATGPLERDEALADSHICPAAMTESSVDKAKTTMSTTDTTAWKPDVYVQSFIPEAFLAVNSSPATSITAAAFGGIDFSKYTYYLADASLLQPLPVSPYISPSKESRLTTSIKNLKPEKYAQYLLDCLLIDYVGQMPVLRTCDLFQVPLQMVDFDNKIYKLCVAGIREGTPHVALGDIVLLRQLILDRVTYLPMGMDTWISHEGHKRETPAPGFTGYELHAVVLGIDKPRETLFLRVNGLMPGWPVCNVSFTASTRSRESFERAVADTAQELLASLQKQFSPAEKPGSSNVPSSLHFKNFGAIGTPIEHSRQTIGTNNFNANLPATSLFIKTNQSARSDQAGSKNWLHRMLFPEETDGNLQIGLPSGVFVREWYDKNLNYEQMKAVDAIQRQDYGSIPFLINGPPGTGKTKTICEAVAQMANDQNFVGSILLCAPSDPAADMLALRLRAQFCPKTLFRLNDFSRTFAEVPQELLPYCYVEANVFNLPCLPVLMQHKIVVTTCRSADNLVKARVTNRDLVSLQRNMTAIINPGLEGKATPEAVTPLHWAALFVDEAAQATEPEILIPLTIVSPHSDHFCQVMSISKFQTHTPLRRYTDNAYHPVFVMAGDPYQLSPRTFDKSTTLHISLFERLSALPLYTSSDLARKSRLGVRSNLSLIQPALVNLIRNYRSHPVILAVPSTLFYADSLIPEAADVHSLESWQGWRGRRWPTLFACNSGIDDCEDARAVNVAGWYNVRESQKAIAYSQDLLASGHVEDQSNICIMSPFPSQVNLLRKMARQSRLWGLNIGPTDAFQGLESRVVILCTTRARKRFLEQDKVKGVGIVGEKQKFNVALTRAKEGLIVLGNPWVLAEDEYWQTFMQFCWRNGLWQEDGEGIDARMEAEGEAESNKWVPDNQKDAQISGFEAALLYKEKQPWKGSEAVRKFMGESEEDATYRIGLEAEAALRDDVEEEEDGTTNAATSE